MSIQEEINRIGQNVADTYSALNEMGATMPAKQNSDNLASTARTVPQGSSGSGTAVQEVEWVDITLDLATVAVTSISHTYQDIVDMLTQGKIVKVHYDVGFAHAYGDVASYSHSQELIFMQVILPANLGDGFKTYQFTTDVRSDGNVYVYSYILSTTSVRG